MKRILILLGSVVLSFTFFSCGDDTTTYSESLEKEKKLISSYLSRNNITVLSSVPSTDGAWGSNQYINPTGNMYLNILDVGTGVGTDSVESGKTVIVRFKSFTLDANNPDTVSNWTTMDYPYPPEFIYGSSSEACTAWHVALSYMKYTGSQAKIIVPSKLGFSASNTYWRVFDDANSVTPRGYILKLERIK